jgi:glycosyltransferase involved in cell wall biosynthesis
VTKSSVKKIMPDKNCLFSIIIVSNVKGQDLIETIDSVLSQKFSDFELIVKFDGQEISSIKNSYKGFSNIKFITQSDIGIYDAMNQAIDHASGDYALFLNVGDKLYDSHSLGYVHSQSTLNADVLYSPYLYRQNIIQYPKKLSRGFFFRNALCHQSYFLRTKLLKTLRFNLDYRVLADHDILLRGQQSTDITFEKINRPIATLALMGFSAKNVKTKNYERKKLEFEHFSPWEFVYFSIFSILSLRSVRRHLVNYVLIYYFYNRIKNWFYR